MKSIAKFWFLASIGQVLCSDYPSHHNQIRHDRLHSSFRSSRESAPWSNAGGQIRSTAYYVNWAIYAREFYPYDINTQDITHLAYAFANVNNVTGEVALTDLWADTQIEFPGHEPAQSNSTANTLYGNLGQLFLLKQKNRNLKTLLSIGGWSYSPNFAPGTDTKEKRKTFATSAVKLLEMYGFDGLDVDWEYPASDIEASNLVALLSEIRTELDKAQKKRSNPAKFYLTASIPAGPDHYSQLDVANAAKYVDYMGLMAYSYSGSFSNDSAYASNFFPDPADATSTPFNTEQAIQYYISHGLAPSSLLLGVPVYGSSFANTQGIGQPFNGTGPGEWSPGDWDYKALPLPNCEITNNFQVVGSYCYIRANQTLIAYDTPEIVAKKAQLAQSMTLGGGMFWETSGDKPYGQGSLVETFVNNSGGHGNLKQEQNCLDYPESPYNNIRAP